MHRIAFLACTLLMAIGAGLSASWAAELVPLYLYNTPPPLNTNTPGNLSDHLAQRLTEASGGKYRFKATFLPRKRLDILVASKRWRGAVIWANPEWFDDRQRRRYLWSHPLATDYNLVASHRLKPVKYDGPASLKGLRLGGVLGHVYPEFESMLNHGEIIREDTRDYELNLLKLQSQRIDVTFLPASSLTAYTRKFPDLPNWLHIAATPRSTFHYYIFCDRSEAKLMSYLNTQISQLKLDTVWHETTSTWLHHQPQRSQPKEGNAARDQ